MHQDDGVQRSTVTGSGAYREYPEGMVSFSISPVAHLIFCYRDQ